MIDMEMLEKKVAEFLQVLKPDYKFNPDFKDTPNRVARMYSLFFKDKDNESEEVEKILSKTFPTNNDQMIIIKDIECFGMCPHHLLPIIYNIDIGYIPNGLALGLSKFARLAICLSKYPKLQENFTTEITVSINKYLKPKGVMVVVNGLHGCMRCRGVEMNSSTVTSDIIGTFKTQLQSRQEFLELIK